MSTRIDNYVDEMNSWFFAKTRFQTEDSDSKIAIEYFLDIF